MLPGSRLCLLRLQHLCLHGLQWHPVRPHLSTLCSLSGACSLTWISRDFNHRVKSVSMTFFKPEEVEKLKAGGNKVARDHWLATWTPQEYPLPDPQNPRAVKEFMAKKYEEKRWIPKQKVQAAPSFAEYPRAPATNGARVRISRPQPWSRPLRHIPRLCCFLFAFHVILTACRVAHALASQSPSPSL